MGIKDLNELIERYAPEALGRVNISFFKGKRIAVDGHNWMYMNMYGARAKSAKKTNFATDRINDDLTREEWITLCIKFIIRWLSYGIIPVFVFDGKHPPAKKQTQDNRRAQAKKDKEEFHRLVDQINSIDILDRTPEMIEKVQKQFTKFIDLNYDEILNLINILNTIGLPWFQAKGEAEQLCSMLAREGKVAAVYSKDTDNLALGCPLLISDNTTVIYEGGTKVPALVYTELSLVLEKTKLTMPQFLDLCILLKCDYNKRPKGYGIVHAYEQIIKYKSVNNLIENKQIVDIEGLNYEECIKNFSKVGSSSISEGGSMILSKPDPVKIGDVLAANNVMKYTKALCAAMAEVAYMLELAEKSEEKPNKKEKMKFNVVGK
jgi:flap endonuclease-1